MPANFSSMPARTPSTPANESSTPAQIAALPANGQLSSLGSPSQSRGRLAPLSSCSRSAACLLVIRVCSCGLVGNGAVAECAALRLRASGPGLLIRVHPCPIGGSIFRRCCCAASHFSWASGWRR
jgi:hypothetical protein